MGCGVFGNDPETVARVFAKTLQEYRCFKHAVFAVLDRQRGTPTYTTFRRELLPNGA